VSRRSSEEKPLEIAGTKLFTGWMPFLSPNRLYQSMNG